MYIHVQTEADGALYFITTNTYISIYTYVYIYIHMYIQVLLHSVIAKCIYRFIVYTGLLRLVGNAVYVAIDLAQLPPSATDIQRRPLLVGYRSLLICVLVSFDISVSPVENGVDFAQ